MILADALETFDGTLLFVSHNRGFLRRLATKIWIVADGKVDKDDASAPLTLPRPARTFTRSA